MKKEFKYLFNYLRIKNNTYLFEVLLLI